MHIKQILQQISLTDWNNMLLSSTTPLYIVKLNSNIDMNFIVSQYLFNQTDNKCSNKFVIAIQALPWNI